MCPRFLFADTNNCAHKGHHPNLLTLSTHGRNRGHIGSNTSNQSAANKVPASNDPGATVDRGRDVAAGSLGVESCATTRREREPGVLLAEVVSRRAARK